MAILFVVGFSLFKIKKSNVINTYPQLSDAERLAVVIANDT